MRDVAGRPILVSLVSLVSLGACAAASPPGPATLASAPSPAGTRAAQTANPCTQGMSLALTAPPVMPLDFIAASQLNADCMAWQEFFYLNWAADPAHPGQPDPGAGVASFGTSGNLSPTVWESYLGPDDVFAQPKLAAAAWSRARPRVKTLNRLSKLGDAEVELGSVTQAGSKGWLTDQSGNLIFYEIHLNQDEYDFITGNQLASAAGQAACASNPGSGGVGGFDLPSGRGNTGRSRDTSCAGVVTVYGQNLGAIEVKAAWRVLPADHSLDYRYKSAAATLQLPDGTSQQATVGLVGLHIIHKVPNAQQFVWATFEQIDNDPDAGTPPTAPVLPANAPATRAPYTLWNPACTPASDPTYQCQSNITLVSQPPPAEPLPACPRGSYTPGVCYPYWAPMQITRVTPVKAESNQVTGYAWSLLPSGSVFNYYRLIDVQWPSTPSVISAGATVPLSAGGITPASSNYIVANTTMETFVQSQDSCMDCHQYASIAQLQQQHVARLRGREVRHVFVTRQATASVAPYASDYSFLFSTETRH